MCVNPVGRPFSLLPLSLALLCRVMPTQNPAKRMENEEPGEWPQSRYSLKMTSGRQKVGRRPDGARSRRYLTHVRLLPDL